MAETRVGISEHRDDQNFILEVTPRNDGIFREEYPGGIKEEVDLKDLVFGNIDRLQGLVSPQRAWNWLLTFPQDDLPVAVGFLLQMRAIPRDELHNTMVRRMDQFLNLGDEGNFLFVAPVNERTDLTVDTSATIINEWLQQELKTRGWNAHRQFQRDDQRNIVSPVGIYSTDNKSIVITDTNAGVPFKELHQMGIKHFDEVGLYDDWSFSAGQIPDYFKLQQQLQAQSFIGEWDQHTYVAHGFMTLQAMAKTLAYLGSYNEDFLLCYREGNSHLKTLDDLCEDPIFGELYQKMRNRLDELARHDRRPDTYTLNNGLTISAIATPDNLHDIALKGVKLDDGISPYPLVLNPRTGLPREDNSFPFAQPL